MRQGRLFQGVPIKGHRKRLAQILDTCADDRDWDRAVVPCAGAFAAAEVIAKHFDPQQIRTSDITLFSSALGYVFAPGKDPTDLEIECQDRDWHSWMEEPLDGSVDTRTEFDVKAASNDHVEYVARVLLTLNYFSLGMSNYFMQDVGKELEDGRNLYAANVAQAIRRMEGKLHGLHYAIDDVYDTLPATEQDDDAVMFLNPPAYTSGYDQMFDTDGMLEWDEPDIPQFDPGQRQTVLDAYGDKPLDIVMVLNNADIWKGRFDTDGWARTHVKKHSEKRREYLLTNFETGLDPVVERPDPDMEEGPFPIWQPGDWLNKHSEVAVEQIERGVAEYYSNLFIKQRGDLGGTAELNTALLVDGKLIGVVGINFGHAVKDGKPYVYEMYGISPVYPELPKPLNRLIMKCITTADYRDDLFSLMNFSTAENNVNELRTTCISKHPEVRINNGVLDLIEKEERDDGRYKLVYASPFKDKTYQQQIVEYLDECERYIELCEQGEAKGDPEELMVP